MPDIADHAARHHGDHGLTFQFQLNRPIVSDRAMKVAARRQTLSDTPVMDVEHAAIAHRRAKIRDLPPPLDGGAGGKIRRRDRTNRPHTGMALSGGGIRSASFGLGVLQGLDVAIGIEGVDYLSTVSGGGYIGCALTAAMQHTHGEFPFTDPTTRSDTASVGHIRDFSNYLIPHGATDVITAGGIIARGLVANAIIVLPIIFILVWITLIAHPDVQSLDEPKFLIWKLAPWLGAKDASYHNNGLWGLHGFWFTIVVLGLDLVFLIFWACAKSFSASQFWRGYVPGRRDFGNSAELYGVLPTLWKWLFFLTVLVAWCETQPFVLYYSQPAQNPQAVAAAVCKLSLQSIGPCASALVHGWITYFTPRLAPLGAVIALFSKYLSDVAGAAKHSAELMAWARRILAKAAIWLAAILIPSMLWLLYLVLTKSGLEDARVQPDPAGIGRLVDWMPWWTGPTAGAHFYFAAFVITLIPALAINPNLTSLYRLYRDRLSKAFLFDPNPMRRDANGDLAAVEQKLHLVDSDLCPYPIINAALNIEASQFVNKRGRNADFFMFTPEYTGSDATGYIGTARIEKDETALDLGTAMAISGAAISSNMGRQTIRPLSLTLALLNIRLGYWLRNPLWIRKDRPRFERLLDIRSTLLLAEMFGLITETSNTIYLTDGGNIENLGVYALLKRRCPIIIAVDAEADPAMGFGSFLLLERYARIDLGVSIDLPWQAIRERALAVNKALDPSSDKPDPLPAWPGPHCAAGEIYYGLDPAERGILLYIKASLTGDENDYLLDYKRRNPDFPHETTGDQFFGEEQLEAYRALGFHIVSMVLNGETPFAVKPRSGETEEQARARILGEVRAAMGIAALAAAP